MKLIIEEEDETMQYVNDRNLTHLENNARHNYNKNVVIRADTLEAITRELKALREFVDMTGISSSQLVMNLNKLRETTDIKLLFGRDF